MDNDNVIRLPTAKTAAPVKPTTPTEKPSPTRVGINWRTVKYISVQLDSSGKEKGSNIHFVDGTTLGITSTFEQSHAKMDEWNNKT